MEEDIALYKSKSNESMERNSKYDSRKSSGHARKKSAHKNVHHKPNKSVIEQVEDEDMDKILHDLKYFKEHINASKKSVNMRASKKETNTNQPKKGKESVIESGDNTTAPSQQASRPRTSRGNRPSSKVGRRETSGGGHSAMGFHSNIPNHHLLYNNIEQSRPMHNRSVNESGDSPRSKKRKLSKGRISPNTFISHHQRQPSAVIPSK